MIATVAPQMILTTPVEQPSEGVIFGKMMVIGWPKRDQSAPLVIWNIAATKAQLRHDMVDPTLASQELSCRASVDRLVGCSHAGIDPRTWKRGYLPILEGLRMDRDYVRHLPSAQTRIVVPITFDNRDCPAAITCTGSPTPPPPPPPPPPGN